MGKTGNRELINAQIVKCDEFYTDSHDIALEMNTYLAQDANVFRGKTVLCPCDDPTRSNFTRWFCDNFKRIGLRKLISTCHAKGGKGKEAGCDWLPGFGGVVSDGKGECDERGKILVLDSADDRIGEAGGAELPWDYLDGDGDFRSGEVRALRDEADMIVTNPPFSLFREFVAWMFEEKKKFSVMGNINAVFCKDIFPLVMSGRMWLGDTISGGDRKFFVPDDYGLDAAKCGIDESGRRFIRVKGVRWFTNLMRGGETRRLELMSFRENVAKSRHKDVKGVGCQRYDNIYAVEEG